MHYREPSNGFKGGSDVVLDILVWGKDWRSKETSSYVMKVQKMY